MEPENRGGPQPLPGSNSNSEVLGISANTPVVPFNSRSQPVAPTGIPQEVFSNDYRPTVQQFHLSARLKALVATSVVIILIIFLGFLFIDSAEQEDRVKSVASLPLEDVAGVFDLAISESGLLSVNGQLRINGAFVVRPSETPTSPTTGQFYVDQDNGNLNYFNGEAFVTFATTDQIVDQETPATLQAGTGISINNSTVTNTGVTSVQGQTGAMAFTAGDGITIDGTTISSNISNALVQGGNAFGQTARIGTNDGYPFVLETNNTARLHIAANGNVGIGDTTPSSLLSVGAGDLFQVNSSGAIVSAAGITSSGNIRFTSLDCSSNGNGGTLTADATGLVSCSDDDGGSGVGAPSTASYLVVSLDPSLANERNLAAGSSLTLVDTGANGSLTINTIQDIRTTASPTFSGLTLSTVTGGVVKANVSGNLSVGDVALGAETSGNYVQSLGSPTGLSVSGNTGEGSTPALSVLYGDTANTATQGNTQITVTAGTNLNGGGTLTLGAGGTLTVNVDNNPTFTGVVTASSFSGSGSALTSLNASNITSGTLANARLSASVSLLGQSIDTSEIVDDTILEADLDSTNTPTDTFVLSFDQTSGGFTWISQGTVAGSGGVTSLNGLAGALNIQGNSQVSVSAAGSNVSLSIAADSIGDSQLAFNTGQHLTTTSAPTFTGATLSGLNCTGNSNGGAITTNGSGQLICSDDNGGEGQGFVDTTGTPALNQLAFFADADTIQGSANLTFDGTDLSVNGGLDVEGMSAFGNNAVATADNAVFASNIYTDPANGSSEAIVSEANIATTSSNANRVFSLVGAATTSTAHTLSHAGALMGVQGQANHSGTGTVAGVNAVSGVVNNSSIGTITTAYRLSALNGTNSGTITNSFGLWVQDQTVGTNDYGIAIDGADTQALWISSGADNTDVANGIGFGLSRDTNLYRSAANRLRTDDSLNVGGQLSVGTTTSVYPLNVLRTGGSGVARFDSDQTTSVVYFSNSTQTDQVGIGSSNSSLTLSAGGATRALITSSGNLGIGDTSPAALLTVGSSDAFQVNSFGAIAAATGITSSGTITFSGLTNCDTIDTDSSGVLSCGTDNGDGVGISSLNSQTGGTQTFANDTNVTIVSATDTHTLTWSGQLAVSRGGTGASTSQGAINAISQLTTNGDILYHNGTNSTRLARGTNGQCLTSNATTLLWSSCDSSNAFVQGGNSFSAQAVIGTNDSNSLAFETNGTTRWLINTSGHLLPNADDTYDIGSGSNRVRDLYLGPASLHIGTDGNEGTLSYNTTTSAFTLDKKLTVAAISTDNTVSGGPLYVNAIPDPANPVVVWTNKDAWDVPNTNSSAYFIDTGDLDGDGDFDILKGSSSGGEAWENTGTVSAPVWTAKPAWNSPNIDNGTERLGLGDLDGDGDLDLMANGGVFNAPNRAYENTGGVSSPVWTYRSAWNLPFSGIVAQGYAFGDMDDDGDLDAFIGDSSGVLHAYENTGSASSPTWTNRDGWDAPDVGSSSYPTLGDLDNDGDLDILVGESSGFSYGIMNTGTANAPTWSLNAAWNTPDVGNTGQPALADLDGDGDLDVLIGTSGGAVHAYENTGSLGTPKTLFGVADNGSEKLKLSGTGSLNINASNNSTALILNGSGIVDQSIRDDDPTIGFRDTNFGNKTFMLGFDDGTFFIGEDDTLTANRRFTILQGGDAAIGHVTSGSRLDVYDPEAASDVDIFRLISDVGGIENVKFRVDSDGDLFTDGTNNIGGGADIAERYLNGDGAQPGDVVFFTDTETVAKTTIENQSGLAGVVSTQPGIILTDNKLGVDVALAGRVPVNVSMANGAVEKGDYLTSGPNGRAVKATTPGPIIGTAMESISINGTIEMFVHLGYYNPAHQAVSGQSPAGNSYVQQGGTANFSSLNVSGTSTFEDIVVNGEATFKGKVTVEELEVKVSLVVNGHIVSRGESVAIEAGQVLGVNQVQDPDNPIPTEELVTVEVKADGTDTAGSLILTTGLSPSNGEFAIITFANEYKEKPRVVLSARNAKGAEIRVFVETTTSGFKISSLDELKPDTTYEFDYIVIGAEASQ